MKKDPFKILKKHIKQVEKEWQKDIDNTNNPVFKMTKQDIKDLAEIENKLFRLKAIYGIEIEIKYPKKPRFYGKGIVDNLLNFK